jgi:tetratricopeptide (TPR) repeat protein
VAAAISKLSAPDPPPIDTIEEQLRAVLVTDPTNLAAFSHYVWLLQEHIFVPVRARERAVVPCASFVSRSISSPRRVKPLDGAASPAHLHDQHELASTVRSVWSRRVYGGELDGAHGAIAWTVYAVIQGSWVPELSRESVSSVVASCRCALATAETEDPFAPASFILGSALQGAWHLLRAEDRCAAHRRRCKGEPIEYRVEEEEADEEEEEAEEEEEPAAQWVTKLLGSGYEARSTDRDELTYPDRQLLECSLASFQRAASTDPPRGAAPAFPLALVGLGLLRRMLGVIAAASPEAGEATWAAALLDRAGVGDGDDAPAEQRTSVQLLTAARDADATLAPAHIALGATLLDEAERTRALVASCTDAEAEDSSECVDAERAYTVSAAEARRCFARAVAIDPHTALPHFALARVHHEDALRASVDAALAHRQVRALLSHGEMWASDDVAVETRICALASASAIRKCDAARASYRRALVTNRYHAASWHFLGLLQVDVADERSDAEESFLNSAKADPTFGPPHNHLALLLHSRGRELDAEQMYRWAMRRKCVARDSGIGRARWWCQSGGCFGLHYRFFTPAALGAVGDDRGTDRGAALRKLDDCGADEAGAAYNLATLLHDRCLADPSDAGEGRLRIAAEARALYQRATHLEPSLSSAWVNLGVLLEGQVLGDRVEALRCYRAAIDANPEDARAHNNLGALLYSEACAAVNNDDDDDRGDGDGSYSKSRRPRYMPGSRVEQLDSFIYRYISHESCSQFDSLPLTYLTISRVEQLDDAEAAFERAVALDSCNTAALRRLADLLLYERRDVSAARECWSAIVSQDDGAPAALAEVLATSLLDTFAVPMRRMRSDPTLSPSFLGDDEIIAARPTGADPFVTSDALDALAALCRADALADTFTDEADAPSRAASASPPLATPLSGSQSTPAVPALAATYVAIASVVACGGPSTGGATREGDRDAPATDRDEWRFRRRVALLCWTRCLEIDAYDARATELLANSYLALVGRFVRSGWRAPGGEVVAVRALAMLERRLACGAAGIPAAMAALGTAVHESCGPASVADASLRRAVSVLLYTVTFYANLAHSLTRSP